MNVLFQAENILHQKWRRVGTGWKVVLAILGTIAGIVGLAILALVGLFKLLKNLAPAGTHNYDMYFPRARSRR